MDNENVNTFEILKGILAEYQEDRIFEPWMKSELIQIFEELSQKDTSYQWHGLSKKEKKLLVKLLKEFGNLHWIEKVINVPTGTALATGYGMITKNLIREFTPTWKRWINSGIGFIFSCLFCGLISYWILGKFSIGVFTSIIIQGLYPFIEYIPAIYLQNEVLIRSKKNIK